MTMHYKSVRSPSFPIEAARRSAAAHKGDDALATAVRDVHRAYTRALQETLNENGIGIGQWFFLRALWQEDGITQRQLSQRVGTMEPTTVTALNSLESRDLVQRVRNQQDRRKVNIFLTERGRELRDKLIPRAEGVADVALHGIPADEVQRALMVLGRIAENLRLGAEDSDWPLEPDALC
jgi:MarR family transcriptional regulator, organic hydroperoxide resistance regulator